MSARSELQVEPSESADHPAGRVRRLRTQIDAGSLDRSERITLLEELINQLVTLSRHREALAYAEQLADLLGIDQPGPMRARLCTWLVAKRRQGRLSRWRLGLARRVMLKPRQGASFAAIRTVQFAFFWHDIRRCVGLALAQLVLASSDSELDQACAWLGYAQAYATSRNTGVTVLRGALVGMHRNADRSGLASCYPLLAIAYQMTFQAERARHYHELFLARYAGATPFYRLLAITNLQASAFARHDFNALRRHIDGCFAECFGLDDSRHHIQAYGWRSVLLAVEGQHEAAEQSLADARRAAERSDNNLDWTIFARVSAYAYIQLNRLQDATQVIESGERSNAAYGCAEFYRREFAFQRALVAYLRDGKVPATPILERAARLLVASVRYTQRTSAASHTAEATFHELGTRLSEALSTSFGFDPSQSVERAELERTLCRVFSTDYVIMGPDLESVRIRALSELGANPLFTTPDDGSELRLVCASGLLVGYCCPRTVEIREGLAVGILLRDLDIVSESLMKAAFRMLLAQFVFVRSIRISREHYAAEKRVAAIGRLTRMLAHDVRQPFSILKVAIDALAGAEDKEEFEEMASAFLSDMERSSSAVDSLVRDVLEIESRAQPQLQPRSPIDLIRDALSQVFQAYPDAKIQLSYALAHEHTALVDADKMLRVLSNIITNAVQALKGKGSLWFVTREVMRGSQRMLELCIGNDGPRIPREDVAEIFDPLYTRNKPNGTGLGLAIARKIVLEHAGELECSPDAARGVEFVLRLPAGPRDESLDQAQALPANSAELPRRAPLLRERLPRALAGSDDAELAAQIAANARKRERPIAVVVVDDEPIYRRWLLGQLQLDKHLSEFIRSRAVSTSSECLSLANLLDTDFFVVDVDLGDQQDGLALVRKLRALGSSALIAVHSNRVWPEDFREAAAAGADACLPKPMTRMHLHRLLQHVVGGSQA